MAFSTPIKPPYILLTIGTSDLQRAADRIREAARAPRGRLRRGPSVILPLHSRSILIFPIVTTNASDEWQTALVHAQSEVAELRHGIVGPLQGFQEAVEAFEDRVAGVEAVAVGLSRIVASEIEVPNMLVNLV